MRITSKGQITIPIEIREQLGLLPYTEVACEVDGDAVRITKTQTRQGRGRSIVAQLRGQGDGPDDDRRNHGTYSGASPVNAVLVDSNVLLDILTEDPTWGMWSEEALARCADTGLPCH